MASGMDTDKPVFAAVLTPHRSIGRIGIRNVVVIYAVFATVPAAYALSLGLWPIVWALVMATLCLWFALRWSLKTGDTFEEVTLFRHELTVRHVTHKGEEHHHAFNPFWVRFDVSRDYADRVAQMKLTNRGQSIEVGSFLHPREKARFADVFRTALHRARN